MLRTIVWYALGWTFLFITFPALWWVKYLEKRGRLDERDQFANKFSMFLAKGLFMFTGSTISVKGADNIPGGQPVLFVSNHQSHMDSAIIHGFINCPKGFIADKEVRNIPILRTWMKYMKCVLIDRGSIRENVHSMEKSIKILKDGHSMVIYPEGKLDEGKLLGNFKKGCIKLAVKAGVPVVPVTMKNSARIMNKDGSKIRSAAVECIISKPIFVTSLENEPESVVIQEVRDIIAKNLE
ncbi:MAG: lysophospholipid acyltransferase family protein [Clostridiaceae bacterium]